MNFRNLRSSNLPQFDNHKLILSINEKKIGLNGFVAIHRGNTKHPAFGATRFWSYITEKDALKDALLLSKTMTYKAALAGLKYGGAKGVFIIPKNRKFDRTKLLKKYSEIINGLKGLFITGADVGLSQEDVFVMKNFSPYIVGAKVDPIKYTALGLTYSLRVCLSFYFGSSDLSQRSVAIQGLGKIGLSFLRLIYKQAKNIKVSDINPLTTKEVKKLFPKVIVISPNEIHKQNVDVYAPCALSHCLNVRTVEQLRCKIIVGGANNQLENDLIAHRIYEMGILYAPDYIVNAGGLISVVDEYENKTNNQARILKKVKRIQNTLDNILIQAKMMKKPAVSISNSIAGKIIKQYEQ